jgi:hypothetical protein
MLVFVEHDEAFLDLVTLSTVPHMTWSLFIAMQQLYHHEQYRLHCLRADRSQYWKLLFETTAHVRSSIAIPFRASFTYIVSVMASNARYRTQPGCLTSSYPLLDAHSSHHVLRRL